MYSKDLISMHNLVGICICGIYLAAIGEVEVDVSVLAYMYAKALDLHAHVACWPCELYLECGSHICSVVYVKYMYSFPCHLVDASHFIYMPYICAYVPRYACQVIGVYGIYA